MKRTHRNIIGLFGLFLVVATTTYAVQLPNPQVEAATETITVQVANNDATTMNFDFTTDDSVFTDGQKTFNYRFSKTRTIKFTIVHTAENGEETTTNLPDITFPDEQSGSDNLTIDFASYGYGTFRVYARAIANDATFAEDTINFTYTRAAVLAPEVPNTGNIFEKLNISRSDYLLTGLVASISFIILLFVYLKRRNSDH